MGSDMIRPAQPLKNAPSVLYVPLQQAVELFGISDAMLRRLCREHRIDAVKHAGTWLVNVARSRQSGTRGPVSPRVLNAPYTLTTSAVPLARDQRARGSVDARGCGGVAPTNRKGGDPF